MGSPRLTTGNSLRTLAKSTPFIRTEACHSVFAVVCYAAEFGLTTNLCVRQKLELGITKVVCDLKHIHCRNTQYIGRLAKWHRV